jgi:hypothetical protein
MRNAYRLLIGKSVEKTLLGRSRRIWEDNIKIDLKEEGVDWILLVQDSDRWRTTANTDMDI